FDAAAIERLVGEVARRADLDEGSVEIVPGLIIVHRGEDYATRDQDAFGDASDEGDEAWSRPFVAGAAEPGDPDTAGAEVLEESREPDAADDAEPAYVNIFAPGASAAGDAGDGPGAARLAAAAETVTADTDPFAPPEDGPEDAPARDIFADTGDSAGGSVFADPMAADTGADPADGNDPVNFFSAPDSADDGADGNGAEANVFASVGPEDAAEDTPEDPGEDAEQDGGDSKRVEALFGRSEDQPEVEEADEGYTAAGLAQTAGAESVADLMVSAAAWMVLIQGQTTFSRRDVIEVFDTIPGDHPTTLEARIKGFGKAVRNGQLIMVEDGVFGLSRSELERFQLLL
ncbi:MAG: hypothetical protein ACE5EU_12780, partial [Paracoccaceae bacterium]